MWLVGFNYLINEYLNCLFIICDTSVCMFNIVKLVISIALFFLKKQKKKKKHLSIVN